jgi:D-lactate dehydrogenase (cytochrome)
LDSLIIECFNTVGNRNFQLKDTVLFKYQGTPAIIADTARLVEEVSREYGGTDFLYFDQEKEAAEIWNLRKTALPQLVKRYPGYHGLVTDVWCVFVAH